MVFGAFAFWVMAGTRESVVQAKVVVAVWTAKREKVELAALGVRTPEARELLAPGYDLLGQTQFWQHPADGLAVFLAPGRSHVFQVPLPLREFVTVADRFHLKPLLPLLTGDGRFYILAISQNVVRLLQATRHGVHEVRPELMPKGFADATRFWGKEKQQDFHVRQGAGGERSSLVHGQETTFADPKDRLAQYFHLIDGGIRPVLQPDNAPLVLAAVEYYYPIYREANTYGHLLEEFVHGNPDGLRDEELHAKAWKIVEPHFLKRRHTAEVEFPQVLGTGRASNDPQEVVRAALAGRVATLFVDVRAELWGSVDGATQQVHPEARPGDQDLLDLAATHTLLKDGTVYAVEPDKVPGRGKLAAVFRY